MDIGIVNKKQGKPHLLSWLTLFYFYKFSNFVAASSQTVITWSKAFSVS